jgi:hypothetical protein
VKLLFIFIILFGILMIFGSCLQKEEVYDPSIYFVEPQEYYIVNMPDTLDVRVEINDLNIIRSVILSLVNEYQIPVVQSNYYFPDSTSFIIETSLALTDKSLETDTYQLLVTVSDGINEKKNYLEIKINEIAARIQAYMAVTTQLDFESTIIRLKPDFETDTQFVIPKKHWLSGVQGLWGEFFFVSGEPSRITAYNTESFDVEWEFAAQPPRPLITAIFTDKELIFSTANGNAGILSADGTNTLLTAPYENKSIRCVAADDKYIYAYHVSLSGDIKELTVYYRVSGSIRVQEAVSGDITDLVPERGMVMAFIRSTAGTAILEYDPEEMIPAQSNFLDGQDIKSVVKISDDQLFLLTDLKVISYDIAINRFTDFTDQPYAFCRYDYLSDIIFLARDNMVYGFDRNTGDLLKEVPFPEEVRDFQILYNK